MTPDPAAAPRRRRRWPLLVGLLTLTLAVVVAGVIGLPKRPGSQQAVDVVVEQHSDSESSHLCPPGNRSVSIQEDQSRLVGGGLSLPTPTDAPGEVTPHAVESTVINDHAVMAVEYVADHPARFSVGIAPYASGFKKPEETALQLIECNLHSAIPAFESYTVVESASFSVDGRDGHWMRVHAVTAAAGGGLLYDAVVLDTGNALGLAAYRALAEDDDPQGLALLDASLEALSVIS